MFDQLVVILEILNSKLKKYRAMFSIICKALEFILILIFDSYGVYWLNR